MKRNDHTLIPQYIKGTKFFVYLKKNGGKVFTIMKTNNFFQLNFQNTKLRIKKTYTTKITGVIKMIKDCPFNTCIKYSEKTCISYPLICTRTYTYEGRSVIEWRAIALAHAHTCQYSFRRAIVACAKLYMSYRTQTL